MILDYLQLLASDLAITATGLATNVLDIEEVGAHQVRQLGNGKPVGIGIFVDVAPDFTTGNETYVATVETDDNAALSSATVVATRTISGGATATPAGTRFFLEIPPDVTLERYLGLRLTLGGTTPTLTYTAYLMSQSEFEAVPKYYTSGFTVA